MTQTKQQIDLRNIRVVYHTRKAGERIALDHFSLSASNEMLALLGPNGSGKSTLLSVIARTIKPGGGEVIAPTSRRSLGVVFQTPALDELLTIRENLYVAGALHDLPREIIRDRIGELAADLGIEDRLDDQVRHLSGGLARRADLARALISYPRVLLLDEPTSGLDIDARRIFWDTLARTRSRIEMTVLLATHLTDEAERADRVLMMRDGKSVCEGTPGDLRASLGDRVIRVTLEHDDDHDGRVEQASAWLNACSVEHVVCDHLLLGHHADPSLASSCPIESASITIAPPTLADVYTSFARALVSVPAQEALA